MNKNVLALIIGTVIVICGVGYLVTKGDDDNSVNLTNSATGQSQQVKTGDSALVAVDACEVLTDAAAQQVLGAGATKSDTSAGNASSDDVSVSNCNYLSKSASSGNPLEQARTRGVLGVLARAAKTKTGAESNKVVFGAGKPAGVQDVSGYGDAAYYNPEFSQMNILKGNNWYIISYYVGLKSTDGTLDQAKTLADAIKDNLK